MSAFALMLSATACGEKIFQNGDFDGLIKVNAYASREQTRTSLNGTTLSWTHSDILGLYINGIASNAPFIYSDEGHFSGYISGKGKLPLKRAVYSYYPYTVQDSNTQGDLIVSGVLPKMQTAPFDPLADYMVSNSSNIVSGGDTDPYIELTFSNHLFSILKIDVTNSNPDLAGEILSGIKLESASNVLSGVFFFDVSLGQYAAASFSEDPFAVSHRIDALYPNDIKLGKDVHHTFNVVVPAGEYPAGDFSVSVYLGDQKGTFTTKADMKFDAGSVHELQAVDIGTKELERRYRTMILFGDSITTRTVADCLQELLGPDWKVYLAGVSGEKVIQIMSRAGAAPLYLKGPFTIPASSGDGVSVGTSFWSNLHTDGSFSETPDIPFVFNLRGYIPGDKATYCGLSNPFMINGVECSISQVGNELILNRTNDGAAVECPEDFVPVVPYAKWKLGNPDVLSVYMGTNGTYTANATTGRTRDQVLADFYHMVQNSTTGEFIAVGYHHGSWNTSYRDTFTQEFTKDGKCCYLDLRTDGCKYAETIAAQEGYVLTHLDKENVSNNIWPATWGGLDIHPYTPVGGRAHAYCIYYKMKELGYLDD